MRDELSEYEYIVPEDFLCFIARMTSGGNSGAPRAGGNGIVPLHNGSRWASLAAIALELPPCPYYNHGIREDVFP
jgi:hypothetical protein